jgi:hypothetical protein
MRWLLAVAEAFAQWRWDRHQRLGLRWMRRAQALRRRQERHPDLFDGDGH